MNLSRKNLTETKLEMFILEYLNSKPFLKELIKNTEKLHDYYNGDVIWRCGSEWTYRLCFMVYKNGITQDLYYKFHKPSGIIKNRFDISKSYIWY